jgi:hypothetical protein
MPDGSPGVKDATPNLHPGNPGDGRVAGSNPGADGPHGGQVKMQVVDGIQNLGQQFVRGVKMTQVGP